MAVSAEIQAFIDKLPAEQKEFFNTEAGQQVITQYMDAGGRSASKSSVDDILELLGITGGSKDVMEEILGVIAVGYAAKEYAQPALKKAEELNNQYKATVDSLLESAKSIEPTAENRASAKGKTADEVRSAFAKGEAQLAQTMAQRGMGQSSGGQIRALEQAKQTALLSGYRQNNLDATNQAVQSAQIKASALPSLGSLASSAGEQAQTQIKGITDMASEAYQNAKEQAYRDEYLKVLAAGAANKAPVINVDNSGGVTQAPAATTVATPISTYTPTTYQTSPIADTSYGNANYQPVVSPVAAYTPTPINTTPATYIRPTTTQTGVTTPVLTTAQAPVVTPAATQGSTSIQDAANAWANMPTTNTKKKSTTKTSGTAYKIQQ